jgi:hypothetical protein
MQSKLEGLIKAVYKKWKAGQKAAEGSHPDEETLACFLEAKLSEEEMGRIKEHLISCDNCAEAFAFSLREEARDIKEVPEEILAVVKGLLIPKEQTALLEIILRLKEKALEIVNTTGDVLLGQELVPASVLRSRSIKDFKDEVNILKDFKDVRVEIRVENKGGKAFNLTIMVKQKQTQKIMKDLRVTLFQEDLELESYLTDSGSVTFEHVLLGKYRLEIANLENKLASVLLDIKV